MLDQEPHQAGTTVRIVVVVHAPKHGWSTPEFECYPDCLCELSIIIAQLCDTTITATQYTPMHCFSCIGITSTYSLGPPTASTEGGFTAGCIACPSVA